MEENLLVFLALDALIHEHSASYVPISDEDFSMVVNEVKGNYGTVSVEVVKKMVESTHILRDKYLNKLTNKGL